ncbi:unnamed protein product [Aphanomyces euteiches]
MAERPVDSHSKESALLVEKVQERLKERVKEQHAGRTDAVLELKANTGKALANIRGQNEKRHAEAQALAESQAREFQDLLAAGNNPYEVFRAQEIAARAAKKVAAQRKKIKKTEMAIAANMVQEALRNQKRDEAEQRHAAYVQKYQKELGRKVVEGRTRDYMLSRTGMELVDPTGRTFRIDPSQVTVLKDHTFGLGKSSVKTREQRDKVIDMIAAKPEHANVRINPRGLPKPKEKPASNQQAEPDAVLLPPLVDPPGKEMARLNGVTSTATATTSTTTTHLPALVPETKKGFGVPKRSKLEEAMRLQALAKQKDNLIEKQVVWGKEFTGLAFLADPNVLWFKDFDVGRPQTLRFTLTNVSHTFNHFKLLPLPDDLRDFFDIKYELPGRMSAGMTCHIQITFCARLNQDITTELPAVAKTGYFSIPLKCTAKRVVPVLSASTISFANVVVGESSKQTLTMRNDGALPATFHITPVDTTFPNSPPGTAAPDISTLQEDDGKSPHESEDALMRFAQSFGQFKYDRTVQTISTTTDGRLEPYGSTTIAFTFAPHRPLDEMHQSFRIVFDPPACVDPIDVAVVAQAVQVPLYIESPVMNFQCCVYGKLYRSKLVLRNRGKTAMKCQLKVPSYLAVCVEFHPNFGYVQGSTLHSSAPSSDSSGSLEPGRFEIQVKFRPAERIWPTALKKRFGWRDGDVVAIPMQVVVPDQVLPVYFVLKAQLTTGELAFSSPSLAFGDCFTAHSVCQTLTITNPSRLPQKFGFLHVPSVLRVEPNDGFGTLLPFDSTNVQIYYSPSSATEFQSFLTCSTTMNRTFQIPCTGRGITPALQFSETVITMAAAPLGQTVVHSLACSNTTAAVQRMELTLPPEAAKILRVSPLVATIEPYSSIRLEVEFHPTDLAAFDACESDVEGSNVRFQVSCVEAVPGLHHALLAENDAKAREYTWSYDLPAEARSFHAMYNVVCFTADAKSQALQSLQVHVSIIEPEIVAKPDKIIFGQVAVGQAAVLKMHVVNNSPTDLAITSTPLHCGGPFSILNALRTITGHGGTDTVLVEFSPTAPLIFNEDLTLHTCRGSLSVRLHGEGVSPVLGIVPPDGRIDFKPVLAREKGFTDFTLLNTSQFPLTYVLKPLEEHAHSNFNHTLVFSCVPNAATIPPGGTQIARATFSPDHERPIEYVSKFRVDVPNQTEDHVITFKGRCWECQSYVVQQEEATESSHVVSEDIFDLPLHIPMPTALADFVKKPPRTIQVQFNTDAAVKKVLVGCVGPQSDEGHQGGAAFSDGKTSSPTTFEIVFDACNGVMDKYKKYFDVEPLKGTVNPGHDTAVAIQFKPNGGGDDDAGGLRILHWIRVTAKITLKGGYIPPSLGAAEQVVQLVLKARVLT